MRARASRTRRTGTWQGKYGPQPRVVVFQFQLAAMQARHSRSKTEPKARARQRVTLLEPDETLDHAAAVGIRNARPVVGHRQRNAVALGVSSEHDLGSRAIDLAHLGPCVFD